jgi:hypothetical protein
LAENFLFCPIFSKIQKQKRFIFTKKGHDLTYNKKN